MKRISASTITLLALAALLTVGSVAFAHDPKPGTAHDSPYDLSFIDMMMMHHSQGIEMARMAESKGQLPQLKEFAARIIADQEKDRAELQGYRDRFYANEPKADKIRMGGMVMTKAEMQRMAQENMRKLEATSGGEFDHLFLDLMTKHHQMAIRVSQDAQKRAEHAEIKEFARMTIAKQGKDIKEMDEMKRVTGGGRKGAGRRRS